MKTIAKRIEAIKTSIEQVDEAEKDYNAKSAAHLKICNEVKLPSLCPDLSNIEEWREKYDIIKPYVDAALEAGDILKAREKTAKRQIKALAKEMGYEVTIPKELTGFWNYKEIFTRLVYAYNAMVDTSKTICWRKYIKWTDEIKKVEPVEY